MLKDQFGRIHDYLRISLTDRCNFRCLYCLPEPEFKSDCHAGSADQMSADEITGIASAFVKAGVNKIRITGGEPLVRKDAGNIMEALGKLPVKLVLTTNGSRVDRFLENFLRSGIQSVNVSLDSLNAQTFYNLTHRNEFDRVKANIDLLIAKGFHVKVNMVVMNGFNDHEILDFVEWTRLTPVHIRFIEFMPFPGNQWRPEKLISYREILDRIMENYAGVGKLEDGPHDTTKKFRIENHSGTFAVISTMSDPFCSGCNRLRLTSDGKMRNCLFSKTETDLLTPFRNGTDIAPLISNCLAGKHLMLGGNSGENWGLVETVEDKRSMMGIGG